MKVMARQLNELERKSFAEFNQQLQDSFGLTAEQRSGQDYMGFTWFEVFKNGKPTGNSFNALDADHAIRMYKQFYK
jgi:hypothetical protein